MALINRVTRLFRADLHAVLDRIEEPDALLKQAIREMEEALDHNEQQLKVLSHEMSQLSIRYSELEQNLEDLEQPSENDQPGVGGLNLDEMESVMPDAGSSQGIDFILDVPLEITVELGRTKMQVGDLLKLGQGSVVELEKLTNEPVDIFINDKLMGHGEVVVVNEKFGIRLTNIISPGERVKKLA